MTAAATCVYCGHHPIPAGKPYCVPCTFAVRAHIETGLRDLNAYLVCWANFHTWETSR